MRTFLIAFILSFKLIVNGQIVYFNKQPVNYGYFSNIPSGGYAYVSLPDTIYLIAEKDYVLYNNNIGDELLSTSYSYTWTSNVGNDSSVGYVLSPTLAQIGYEQLIVSSANSDTTILAIIPEDNGASEDTVSILAIGNSLTNSGAMYTLDTLRTSLIGIYDTLVGTRGISPNNHLGIPGKTYDWFIYNAESPFANGFEHYYTDSIGRDTVGLAIAMLGINDVSASGSMAFILGRAKSFVDSLLSIDYTKRILVTLPSSANNSGTGSGSGTTEQNNAYLNEMWQYRYNMDSIFGGKRYDERVYVNPQGLFIDRNLGYPKLSGVHSNWVHPNDTGYYQLGVALHAATEGILFSERENSITNHYFDTWAGNPEPNDYPTGWALSSNDATNFYEQDEDGNCHVNATGTSVRLLQNPLTIGKKYKLTLVISSKTEGSGAIRVRSGGSNRISTADVGVHTVEFTATGTDIQIFPSAVNCNLTLSYISAVEIE